MTTAVAVPTWPTLTPAQQRTLLDSADPLIGVGVELLNFDLTTARDISTYVQIADGDIQWQGDQVVNRDIKITLSLELPWGIALIRVYRTITDQTTGLTARVDRGVFVLNTPDHKLGSVVLDQNDVPSLVWTVDGQDRASLLDRLPGYSVAYDAVDSSGNPVTVVSVLQRAYADAGLPGFLVDGAAAASLMPRAMVWPMVSSGSGETSSTDAQTSTGDPAITAASSGSSDGATWRQIINDLHSLINYAAVWCDEQGLLRSGPYFDPAGRPPSTQLAHTDGPDSALGVDRTLTTDPWHAPNRWIFIWSNMPQSSGAEQTPTTANGGVIVTDNVADGPASQTARNGLVYAAIASLTAATANDFAAQAAAQVAADKRVVTTYQLTLHPAYLAVLGHHTVATLVDADIPGGQTKVRITSWTESFDNQPISVTAESV